MISAIITVANTCFTRIQKLLAVLNAVLLPGRDGGLLGSVKGEVASRAAPVMTVGGLTYFLILNARFLFPFVRPLLVSL